MKCPCAFLQTLLSSHLNIAAASISSSSVGTSIISAQVVTSHSSSLPSFPPPCPCNNGSLWVGWGEIVTRHRFSRTIMNKRWLASLSSSIMKHVYAPWQLQRLLISDSNFHLVHSNHWGLRFSFTLNKREGMLSYICKTSLRLCLLEKKNQAHNVQVLCMNSVGFSGNTEPLPLLPLKK